MAIQISGTTVVNNSRQLQNIASLDSTTTSTIAAAAGVSSGTYAQGGWINFNAIPTGIRQSGNVSSLTDYGTGQWGVTMSNSLTDSSFVFSGYYGGGYPHTDVSARVLVEVSNTARSSNFIRFSTRAVNSGSQGLEDGIQNSAQFLR